MALAGILVYSGGLKAPTGTTSSRGEGMPAAVALIPTAQASFQQPAAKAARHTTNRARQGLSSLPAAAQAVVSATLGENDARHQVRPKIGAQLRRADVPRASCPSSGMAKMAMAQSVGALTAQNPAQALQADFTRQGMEVRSGQTHWRLALGGYGYGESLEKVAEAAPQSRGNRVEYKRGPLVEWYVNGPVGLEQGFTLAAPPSLGTRDAAHGTRKTGHGIRDTEHGASAASGTSDSGLRTLDSSLLTIALQVGGDLTATADSSTEGRTNARAEGLTLRDSKGHTVLRYTGLSAYDASGRTLAAWLEVGSGELRLRVDDAGARYPVVVDPFVQQAVLTASDGVSGDLLGISVVMSADGTTIVAGASQEYNDGTGAAYVFVMPAGGWASTSTFTAKLTASDGEDGDQLGQSVGVSSNGSTIVAGAIYANTNQTTGIPGPGAACLFAVPSGGWASAANPQTQTAKLTASDGASFDSLGSSVSIRSDGSTIVAGAPFATVGSTAGQGAAYVFVMPGRGGWVSNTQTAKLTASDGELYNELGTSVGIKGDGSTIVAGAPSGRIAGDLKGAAYVFAMPGSGWATTATFTAKLTASDAQAYDDFGYSVGISNDGSPIVAGSPQQSADGPGAAYVFVMPGGGWGGDLTQTAELAAGKEYSGNGFGSGVGVSGDGMAIAAGVVGLNSNQGAVSMNLTAPTVTFTGAPASQPYQGTFTLADATTNSPSPLVYSASGSCSLSGTTTYTMTSGTGACYEIVSEAATVDYASVKVNQRTRASKIAPTVAFTGAPAKESYKATFTVDSTTNSSSTPVYKSSGPCSNSGAVYTITRGNGTCTSTVSWVADANYERATLSQTTTAKKIGQAITFTTPAPATASDNSNFTVAVDSTSGLTVKLSLAAGSKIVCSLGTPTTLSGVTSATVTMLSGTGTCTIDANQAGNNDYTAAALASTSATATP
jgi:hypothetical protein